MSLTERDEEYQSQSKNRWAFCLLEDKIMAQDFETILNLYRKNILEYKVTGNSFYKTTAESSKKWLDEYIGTIQASAIADSKAVDAFVKNYANTNPELDKMQQQIKKVKTEGPKLQDVYETEKKAEKEPDVDVTIYYTKAAVIGGVLAIAAVVSFL
jgi:hypothetical protein